MEFDHSRVDDGMVGVRRLDRMQTAGAVLVHDAGVQRCGGTGFANVVGM